MLGKDTTWKFTACEGDGEHGVEQLVENQELQEVRLWLGAGVTSESGVK